MAIRDAVTAVSLPLWEVYITNVHSRQPFRHHSYLSDVAQGVICGYGIRGYRYALLEAAQD
ncbi:3-dehydroquinate dehydratase [Erwinia amylovora Ea644]|nr:3-dehydroquinate dehydratase [Erwinia amylovora Ea644]